MNHQRILLLLLTAIVASVTTSLILVRYSRLRAAEGLPNPTDIPTHLLMPPAPTVLWGQDLLKNRRDGKAQVEKAYLVLIDMSHVSGADRRRFEFGLRSDGVVVWREIK